MRTGIPTRTVHFAGAVRKDGAVSALCYAKLRPINLKRCSWTNRKQTVTCPDCKRVLREQEAKTLADVVRT